MTEDLELQRAVAAQFCALADLLSEATDAVWNTESLCDGWRVLEVVAHMTMPARYSQDEFMAELEGCGYDFTRLSNAIAVRDAGLPPARLVADLRSDVLHHWTPPGGGLHGALDHAVIHSLDVRVILDDLTHGGIHKHFTMDIEDRMMEASDLDWHCGSGSPLRGTAEMLALAMCGRQVPNERLDGAPLRRAKASG